MKSVLRAFNRSPKEDPLLYIVVIQYQRADFDLGQEQEFHWAIAIIQSLRHAGYQHCRTYQVFDRTYTAENRTVWNIHVDKTAVLKRTTKWRGGVIIGRVKQSQLEALDYILSHHEPVVKFEGWNCRSWVMECIEMMAARGWVPIEILSQERLVPTLRVVNTVSSRTTAAGESPVIYELDQGV